MCGHFAFDSSTNKDRTSLSDGELISAAWAPLSAPWGWGCFLASLWLQEEGSRLWGEFGISDSERHGWFTLFLESSPSSIPTKRLGCLRECLLPGRPKPKFICLGWWNLTKTLLTPQPEKLVLQILAGLVSCLSFRVLILWELRAQHGLCGLLRFLLCFLAPCPAYVK